MSDTDYYSGNGAFRLLLGAGRWRIVRFVIILALLCAVNWGACVWDGCLYTTRASTATANDVIGFYEDVGNYAMVLSLILFMAANLRLFRKMDVFCDGLASLLQDAKQQDTDKSGLAAKDSLVEYITIRNRKNRRHYLVCIVLCASLYVVFQHVLPFVTDSRVAWSVAPRQFPIAFSACSVWSGFWMIVILGNIGWYVCRTAYWFSRRIREWSDNGRFRVLPLAPDGHGGLSAIGDITFSLVLAAVPGVVAMVGLYSAFKTSRAVFLLGAGLYLALLLWVFYSSLWATHRVMRQCKETELKFLNDHMQKRYGQLKQLGLQNTAVSISWTENDSTREKVLMEIQKFASLCEKVHKMRTWPISHFTTSKLVALCVASGVILEKISSIDPAKLRTITLDLIHLFK